MNKDGTNNQIQLHPFYFHVQLIGLTYNHHTNKLQYYMATQDNKIN